MAKLDTFTKLTYLSSLHESPDKEMAAFLGTKVDLKNNTYLTDLYLYKHKKIQQLTSDGKVSSFFFGVSEEDLEAQRIYFPACRSEAEQERRTAGLQDSTYYSLSLHGGEAQVAFHLPFSIGWIKAMKDGRFLISAGFNKKEPELFLETETARRESASTHKEKSFCHEIEEIPFFLNGAGYTYGQSSRLFIYDPVAAKRAEEKGLCVEDEYKKLSREQKLEALGLTALTDIQEQVYGVTLSEDESKILLITAELTNRQGRGTNCYEIELPDKSHGQDLPRSSRCVLLDQKEQRDVYTAFYFKGEIYALISDHDKIGINQDPNLYQIDSDGKMKKVIEDGISFGSSVGTDVRYGGNRVLINEKDKVYYLTTDHNLAKVIELDPKTGERSALDLGVNVDGYCFLKSGELLTISFADNRPMELYSHKKAKSKSNLAYDAKTIPYGQSYKYEAISHFNSRLGAEVQGIEPEYFNFDSNGASLDGFVIKPSGYDPSKKYPAILDIHGGPKTVYGAIYFHEMQYWASLGYFVFFTNPHGADGRGDEFSDIRGRYGEIDYEDIMTFTDEVLKRYPAIDVERVGVTGGSYGGFMTNWIITHTDRFKAAATQRSIMNWLSFYGTSDIGYYFATDQNNSDTFSEEGFQKMWARSPLRYINNAKTPTLIIHSEEDYRCPLEQGQQLLVALIDRGIDCKMVQFKGETHELSRSGKPKARIKRLDEITSWMDRYLQR